MKKVKAALDPLSGRVHISFTFDKSLVDLVRQLPDARYEIRSRGFSLPPSSFAVVVDLYGVDEIEMGDDVRSLLAPDQTIGYENPTIVDPAFAPVRPTWAMLTTGNAPDGTDYQATGSSWLIRTPRGLLLDDMGLGKSKQFIDAASHLWPVLDRMHVLVICRASNVDTWAGEIEHFAPIAEVNKFRGATRTLPNVRPDVLYFCVMSYEAFRKDHATIAAHDWDWICLDEGHAIKSNPLNKQSEIARLIHTLDADRKLIMTGTPMPNNPAEVYNQLVWLGLEERGWDAFAAETLITIDVGSSRGGLHDAPPRRKIVGFKPLGLRALRKKLLPHVIRRTKDDVLNLPPKIRQTEIVTLSAVEERIYLGAETEFRLYENENPDADFSTIMQSAQMVRLRQITSDASLFSDKPFVSAKIQRAAEIVADAVSSGQKVLIFSQFRHVVSALELLLEEYNPAVITGDVTTLPNKKGVSPRQLQIEKFQGDDSCRVFLGTAAACRYGFTLTAASVEIFIDVDWNEDYNTQNEDRAYRIGQTRSVTIYRLQAALRNGHKTFDSDVERFIRGKQTVTASMLQRKG